MTIMILNKILNNNLVPACNFDEEAEAKFYECNLIK